MTFGRRLTDRLAVSACCALLAGSTAVTAFAIFPPTAWAQTTGTVSIPAAPVPTATPFLAQVAGRAAVADSAYALSKSQFSVSAKWRILTQDERKRVSARTGSETLIVNPKANRVNLASTINPAPNTPQTVARFVSDGNVLLGTRFVADTSSKPQPPMRTFFRIPIGADVETATEALILAKANEAPLTRVARAALLSPLENGGYGWRGRGTFAQNADGTVTEILPAEDNERRTNTTTRRYRFDTKTRFPLSIEEWVMNTNKERKTTRTVYRQETFTYGAFPTRTDVFTTKPAANYAETSPPSAVRLPDPPGPDQADEKSRALLSRWERAWARMGAYSARIAVSSQTLALTPESRPIPPQDATQEGAMTLYYNRPGCVYLASEPNPQAAKDRNGMDRRRATLSAAQSAVSDGKTLAVYDGAKRLRDSGVNGDDTALRQALRRNGFDDRSEALTWIFDGPQTLFGNAEFAEYRGVLPFPGGRAEAVTVRQTFTQDGARRRRGRRDGGGAGGTVSVVQTTTYSTIYFDTATGLPLRIERYITTNNTAAIRRDTPPNRYFSADYGAVQLNQESSPGIFALPGK